MTFHIITLFPESFESILASSILKRAIGKKIIKVKFVNPRDFAKDKHKSVDDSPYGGGSGMVMRADIIIKALESIKPKPYVILLSASGKKYTQKNARQLAKKKNLAIICGHYEGVDARVEKYADEILSIGDYITTGGEIPAMVLIDSITRLLPGAITKGSAVTESFSKDLSLITNHLSLLLEYPQYTRPEDFRGQKVPKVLLSGNHKKIGDWRQKEAVKLTKKRRPDLLKRW